MNDGWKNLRRVFRLPTTQTRIDQDVENELRFHLDGRIEELMEREHLTREAAAREATRRFGDFDAYRREARDIDDRTMRDRSRIEILDTLGREIRHAARVLLRTPAFSLITFITLAIGIGATTAIYTVLDAVVMRPLPYREADRLVSVLHPTTVPGTGESKWGMSSAGYFYFKQQNHTLESLGGYQTSSLTVTGTGPAEPARVGVVTASIFPTLRARAALGRLISDDDDKPSGPDVVVLSYEYWKRHFGGDRAVIGQVLQTSFKPFQIIGIAEPGLTLPKPGPWASTTDLAGFGVDLWMAEKLDPNAIPTNSHQYSGIGRLKPGVTAEDAQRDLTSLMANFPKLFPTAYSVGFIQKYNFRVGVAPMRDEVLGPKLATALWLLFAAVGVVLLIACANVANLFLVRMEARRRESAIRTALGADRRHMAFHFLSESLLLTIAAGVAGLVVALIVLRGLLAIAPTDIPRLATAGMTWIGVAFAATLSIGAGVLFGLIPLGRTKVDVATLREGGRGLTASTGQRMARNSLVVGQIALALMLLTAAGLMLRSFAKLREVKSGLEPAGVLTFEIGLPYSEYKTAAAGTAFQQQFQQRLAGLPGVKSVGAATGLPLQDFGSGCTVVFREGRPYDVDEKPPCVSTPSAMPGFFESLGIQVRGKTFAWSDVDPSNASATVAIVTQAMATRLWGNEDPIGKGVSIGGGAGRGFYRVAGVIPEIRAHGLDHSPSEIVFWAAANSDEAFTVRTTLADPTSLIPSIRSALAEMNPRIPITSVRTMTEIVDRSVARTSFIMTLLATAGSMALLLSAVGMYGVISYLVTQRRSEIGVRMALGAGIRQVAGLVLGQSVRLALIGVGIGLLGAIAGTRVLRSLLFGVSPTDPVVLIGASVALIVIAAVASLAPTRRAAKIDPVEAMRTYGEGGRGTGG
jgi:putative ABC transport system permease protein